MADRQLDIGDAMPWDVATAYVLDNIETLLRRASTDIEDDEPLEVMRHLSIVAGEVQTALAMAASGARAHEHSWTDLGAAVGTTRAAAWQRWHNVIT